MVLIKIAAILIFVFGAARAVKPENWHPFMPNGFSGVLTGAPSSSSPTSASIRSRPRPRSASKPQRDLPLGIITTLVVCTMLYVAVALVLTGIAHWDTLNNAAPVANALKALGFDNIRRWVGRWAR